MSLLILNGFFVLGLIGLAFWFWRRNLAVKQTILSDDSDGETLLLIQAPRLNDRTPMAAEQMFASLHGIFRQGLVTQPQISFEIVSRSKAISFYAYCPNELKEFVISQLYAQYPNLEIKEIAPSDDYTRDSGPDQSITATTLTLKKPAAYPIKTFPNFEVDPLSGITGVLGSLTPDEQVWIQIIIRPVDDDWQEAGEKAIREIKQPAKPKGFRAIMTEEVLNFSKDFLGQALSGKGGGELEKKEKKEQIRDELTGSQKQAITGIEEKITKLGFQTTIQILAASPTEAFARAKLEQTIGAFKQFNSLHLNAFVTGEVLTGQSAIESFVKRRFGHSEIIFNTEELASIFHFPSETVATPTITWSGSKKGEPPANLPIIGQVAAEELTVFAQTNFRSEIRKFGIKRKDRRLHTYIIGKTGTGKSTLLENMIIDDINEGRGLAVVDPHGELIKHVLEFIPEQRLADVVYFNPADVDHPVGFNLLENVNPEQKNIVASGVVGVLEKIFGEISWGPRLEYILRNVVLALLEYPNSTFMGIMRLLTDASYRRLVLNEVKDPVIRDFFINEFEKYDPKFRTEAIAPIQNKVGQFLSSSTIRNIIGQPHSTIKMDEIMDEGKILLVDLSIGRIGEDNSTLLGSMIITKIQLAAMNRADVGEESRRDFYLYVDEFQNFATDSFATILSEARKYRLNLVMANQYVAQMPEKVADAVFGNVGTMVSFRVGAPDAAVLEREYEPVFTVNDLVNLDNYNVYLKMAVDGVTVPAFSAVTLPPRVDWHHLTDKVVEESRRRYARDRSEVEDYIVNWSEPINLSSQMQPEKGESGNRIVTVKNNSLDSPAESSMVAKSSVANGQAPTAKNSGDNQPLAANESLSVPVSDQLKSKKIEIIKDRFDRGWYAVSALAYEAAEAVAPVAPSEPPRIQPFEIDHQQEPTSPTKVEEGRDRPIAAGMIPPLAGVGEPGETEGSEPLISWDQAESLGVRESERRSNDDVPLTPIDEI